MKFVFLDNIPIPVVIFFCTYCLETTLSQLWINQRQEIYSHVVQNGWYIILGDYLDMIVQNCNNIDAQKGLNNATRTNAECY